MARPKILIVDDDPAVRRLIRRSLEIENMDSFEVDNGHDALIQILESHYDLVLLDINLEHMDGYDVLREVRKKEIEIPIFLLSGRGEDHDKVLGYGIGADTYVTKPFSPVVLAAMIKSHLKKNRRYSGISADYIDQPPFRFDKNSYTLYKDSSEIPLSSKEAKLIRFFMENKDKVFTKDQLYENVWNNAVVSDNTIMVFMRKLRTKIEDDPGNPKYLRTVWGIGYMFTNDPDKHSAN